MKNFLLMMGDNYYPDFGTRDWQECFETYEDALAAVEEVRLNGRTRYIYKDHAYDWYEIEDLSNWYNPTPVENPS